MKGENESALSGDRNCVKKRKTPPALAAWSFNFDLQQSFAETQDTTDFSRVEFQLQPNEWTEKRLKLKLHSARAGGVLSNRS